MDKPENWPSPPVELEEDIAYAMEVPRALLPWLPELVGDLPDLSGATGDVLTTLGQSGFPKGGTVLDLGCGRGEIAMAVAETFNAHVTGIDGMPSFVEIAKAQARERGLEGLCHFEHGNLRETLAIESGFDAVLMIALGPILGNPGDTEASLRRTVVPGGLILIDDGYLVGPPPAEKGWECYVSLKETERQLTWLGDKIEVRLDRRASMDNFEIVAGDAIKRRAGALARRRPELADMLRELMAEAYGENSPWNGDLMPAMWCLRRKA